MVSMSLVLFPRELLENLVLVEMNKNIKKEKIEVFLYFLQRIGIFMSAEENIKKPQCFPF